MNRIEIDRVGVWGPKVIDDLSVKTYPRGIVYYRNNTAATSSDRIYRYAKNYTVSEGKSTLKYCLFLATFSKDAKKVAKYLNSIAKTISAEYVRECLLASSANTLKYTDDHYGGKD